MVEAATTPSFKEKLTDVYNKYLNMIPPDIRSIVKEILRKLSINLDENPPSISLDNESVEIPKSLDSLNYAIETLLYRSGYGKLQKETLGRITFFLYIIIRDIIGNWDREKPRLSVEVKHVTEREELYYRIVKEILQNHIIKTFYVSSSTNEYTIGMFCYDGLAYRPCDKEIEYEIEKMVEGIEEVDKKTTRWVIKEAISKIKRKTLTRLHYEPLMIAFKNVILDWEKFLDTGVLRESIVIPSPDIIVFHRIPHKLALEKLEQFEGLLKFSEEIASSDIETLARKLCPKTLKAFKDWVGEKWILLFEIIGYTLYPKYDMHKAIMLVGEGRNGKSTYLRFVKDILGPNNVTSIALQDLVDESNKRFYKAQLYHKLANIYADLPSYALKSTGQFKLLTGEDTITADRKYKDPITFVNYAKLIFSTNELPKVHDKTIAFWRRWLVIEFPNQFPLDPTFYERTFTEEEKEGAIIVSLYAFRNAWKRGRFSFEETEADYREKWLRESNSVYAFIQDLLEGKLVELLNVRGVRDENGRVETGELYYLYVQYCEAEGRETLPKGSFTKEMERLGYRRVKVKGYYYYKGLRLEKLESTDKKEGIEDYLLTKEY